MVIQLPPRLLASTTDSPELIQRLLQTNTPKHDFTFLNHDDHNVVYYRRDHQWFIPVLIAQHEAGGRVLWNPNALFSLFVRSMDAPNLFLHIQNVFPRGWYELDIRDIYCAHPDAGLCPLIRLIFASDFPQTMRGSIPQEAIPVVHHGRVADSYQPTWDLLPPDLGWRIRPRDITKAWMVSDIRHISPQQGIPVVDNRPLRTIYKQIYHAMYPIFNEPPTPKEMYFLQRTMHSAIPTPEDPIRIVIHRHLQLTKGKGTGYDAYVKDTVPTQGDIS